MGEDSQTSADVPKSANEGTSVGPHYSEETASDAPEGAPIVQSPWYQTVLPNQEIRLYSGALRFSGRGYTIEGSGVLVWRWVPTPRLRFRIEYASGQEVELPAEGTLGFVDLGSTAERAFLEWPEEDAGKVSLRGTLLGEVSSLGGADHLKYIVFHIVGFCSLWHGPLKVALSGWTVAFANAPRGEDIEPIDRQLQEEGGYGLTTWGWVAREDGTEFDASSAEEVLHSIGLALSFARGAWCLPMLMVGFGPGSSRVPRWYSWDVMKTDRWASTTRTWFEPTKYGVLEALLPGLHERRTDPTWTEAIEIAISWYVEAVSGAQHAETSLILAEAALERLACGWKRYRRTLKQKVPKGDTADQLREILRAARIPLSTPDHSGVGQKNPKGGESRQALAITDGPSTVIKMRHDIVHPTEHSLLAIPTKARLRAKELGLNYLELILLWLAGYKGEYRDRLADRASRDRFRRVPWADEDEPKA